MTAKFFSSVTSDRDNRNKVYVKQCSVFYKKKESNVKIRIMV